MVHSPDRLGVEVGRWALVGGWWVEPNINMPNGEALVRQGLYGQQFFQHLFGRKVEIGIRDSGLGIRDDKTSRRSKVRSPKSRVRHRRPESQTSPKSEVRSRKSRTPSAQQSSEFGIRNQ